MKILLINEFQNAGGTEIQTFREWELFNLKGHKTYLLTFDDKEPLQLEGSIINYPLKFNMAQKAIIRLLGSSRHKTAIKEIINKINPDVIHLNNVINLPNEVMDCIKDIPSIQTIRDYSAVCPKSTCIHKDGTICKGYMHENCWNCMRFSLRKNFKLIALKHYNMARLRSVNVFTSPSQALATTCTENGISTICVNNPFNFSQVKHVPKSFKNKKIYLYYGTIAVHKGIYELFKAFDSFAKEYDVELWIIGKVEMAFKKRFKDLMQAKYAKYLGIKKYSEIMDLYPKIYCVVVPSLWIENYPNTVLEALANKTLVIGSDRGGIPELIQNDKCCFDICNEASFVNCLKTSVNLEQAEYEEIITNGYNRIYINNSQDTYYERLVKIYNGIL